ncbi:CAP domain-containing protein [Fictibacillus iocasae]|uniref:CAP domain-containing protein n=1 Tax=Fictibacillus iocasae TaxID=2715437 RepID=A0ABW2NL15_9BACL
MMKKLAVASVLGATLFGSFAGVSQAATPQNSNSAPCITDFLNKEQQAEAQAPAAPAPQQNAAPAAAPAPEKGAEAPKSESNAELTADEQQMLDLVNQEREKAGLPALKADMELTKVARVKAQDMIDNNYFDHNSPTYGSPFDMMKKFGIEYQTAGENLAGNSSVEGAHEGLMNSQGHRENILKSDYTNVGIAVVEGGQYGKMFVQMFKG